MISCTIGSCTRKNPSVFKALSSHFLGKMTIVRGRFQGFKFVATAESLLDKQLVEMAVSADAFLAAIMADLKEALPCVR